MDSENIKEKIKIAREAVKDEDEPYKTEAFKIILSSLINGSPINSKGKAKDKAKDKAKEKSTNRVGPKTQIETLIRENFFEAPKSSKNILNELKNRSYHYKPSDITRPLQNLTREHVLRRQSLKDEQGQVKLHWANW